MSARDMVAGLAAGRLTVLDVRGEAEWEAGHVPGAAHIPLGSLAARLAQLPTERPIAVHCAAGTRSPIAASLLRSLGVAGVSNVPGGLAEYRRAGLPIEPNAAAA